MAANGYLAENVARWSRGYDAENVDHPVFRFYGRILKVDGPQSGKLLDFGCGAGAAVAFFARKGYEAFGVDIGDVDIAAARERFPEVSENLATIGPDPSPSDRWFGGAFDVIVSIQTLYYLDEDAIGRRLASLDAQLNPGGIFYATMMGTQSWYFERSEPSEGGMRRVAVPERVGGGHEHVLFTDSEAQLCERFGMFEPLHVGFYSERFRGDEGQGHHYTFVGRKRRGH